MTRDPVCGMEVDPERSAGTSEYQGQTQYFCSAACKLRFDEEPARYTEQSAAER